ncbi:peptidase S41 [Neosynechococcus sphagnicola sy1]|uniref:Peptidase S41 n=1 Tax=Neosynechococcus sphagnicola sy1 TaxID=1497020 RepID=A0A098TGT9_9CYAN|nr:carboxyl-terminal processing protease CtpB [Neosynechococcus sphagnicola]KGF71810.1 peptidase S41 [Neosynechococcus sphagnicola sy1]
MNRTSKRFPFLQAALFGGAVATTVTLTLFGPGLSRSVRAALQDSPKTVVDEAWQIVNREYVDGTFNQVDWQAVRQSLLSKNYTTREQAYVALKAALEKLGDPYTRFMDPKQYEALSNQTAGELSGVGIRLEVDGKSKILTVVEPIDNSPAAKAGIKPGDQILAIDGKPTFGLSVEDASNLIRGEVGTKVTLRIMRSGEDINQILMRERIELPTVRYSLNQEGNVRVGYIRLSEFSSHAAEQMQRAIQNLKSQNAEAFVLDLRGNPGGLLQASVEITRMWLETGTIVRTVDRRGNNEEISTNRTALTDLPLAILVDGNSASSSEILTGALKDNNRAAVVGTQTFGKALVQSVHELSDGSGLAVTIAHYYTPNGTDISHKGIAPDVKVELTEAQRQTLSTNPKLIGTKEDPQYAQAISVLEQPAVLKPSGPKPAKSASN